MPRLLDVALPVPLYRAFSYLPGEGAPAEVVPGTRVVVPFRGGREVGIVLGVRDEAEGVRPYKAVLAWPDATPALPGPLLATCRWIASHYVAPIGVTMRSALPVLLHAAATPTPPEKRRRVAVITRLLDSLMARDEAFKRAPRQREVYEFLEGSGGRAPVATVVERLKVSDGVVTALATRGLVRLEEESVLRDPFAGREVARAVLHPPTAAQQAAIDGIVGASAGDVVLLHGVTGSGKTLVYLEVLRQVLAEPGATAIVLVPEIALTPQAIRRYGERFGSTLAVFHSGLGTGELYDQWYAVKHGKARLVLGSRSALFAPAGELGLVVIDEEHEWTYKQENPQPRYHARDAARELCRLTGAALVLGSATPDIVTYHHSELGSIRRFELEGRVAPGEGGETAEGTLPRVTVVDMREQLKHGHRSVFSVPLTRALRLALQRKEQSILFVNRRGSARFMLCRACGHVPACTSCELALSLDMSEAIDPRLRCHHCGRSRRLEERCPACDSPRYRPFGVGTQRIEVEAKLAFPGARVARWDSDVASRKGSHAEMVRALESREIDILVGTQMLAKGLDLPAMTVVGVVDADVGLALPDYTAQERTFQLLSQVAGRAGRRDREGFVYIQTYQPEAAPIVAAASHDYRAFYEDEIAHRRRAGYPPFARLARLVHRDTNRERGLEEAGRIAAELRMLRDAAGRAEPDVLGPMAAFIPRVRGEYRFQVLLRGRHPARLLESVRLGERWGVDIDPASLL